jgi:hypothetical protein
MADATQVSTRPAAEVVRQVAVEQASNGVCFASTGEIPLPHGELERLVGAVPRGISAALLRNAYYFVPLAVGEGDELVIADRYDLELSDRATCHRNLALGGSQCVFISTRLMEDRFAIAFEFYINVGHAFVERAGVAQQFADLAWQQVEENVRGETSLDAWELRQAAVSGADRERARNDYAASSFSDALAIYMLSLYLDVDYYELRERDYPLLAPLAMGERLRLCSQLFPPNPTYEFAVRTRRRG